MTRAWSALLALLTLTAPLAAQEGGRWLQEFTQRPAEWGGDIRYALLDAGSGQTLQLGCTANRIERVLVVFRQDQGVPAPISPSPDVRYAVDGGPLQDSGGRLFEAGAVEIPRGSESAALTKSLAGATRLRVEATRGDGAWMAADFDLTGIDRVLPAMLTACGIDAS